MNLQRPTNPTTVLEPGILVGGEWFDRGSAGTREHTDPTTESVQQAFPLAGRKEVDAAVRAARAAMPAWRAMALDHRQAILCRLGELIRAHAEELAVINALEVGTPAALSHSRYVNGHTFFDYYAGWLDKAMGDTLRLPGALDFTLLEPLGVIGAILTWNHPLANIQTTVAPALAAGCAVVIKPPEQAPFAALRFGRLCAEAGLPDGLVNVLPGDGTVGAEIVGHPGVDKVAFVGGLKTARHIQRAAAETLKPLVLELGGKSANVVFADADLDAAVTFALRFTSNSGQGCSLPSRLLVEGAVFDEVAARVAALVEQVPIGDPFTPGVQMGPVIDHGACDRILAVIDRAVTQRSGRLVTGGHRLDRTGYFLAPTVFADVPAGSELDTEEIFGPVLVVQRFDTEAEAIELANASMYGLAGYVHTANVDRAMRVAGALEVGSVGINGGGAPAGPFAPFGGVKQSGYGKAGGLAGLMEYLRVKNVLFNVSEVPTPNVGQGSLQ
ncbi:aldehyde dehydrogenase family protein [Sphaerimonospora thailandensis]|uniref:Betaine-aldehyde dehydrogenase n=1 Tax=Sphaerimonospora thailandensis TaxID=795644 RepID=A0A8J3W1T6_9ACTN|nr:aldehyde dehydrogenase family protein [Sphaerimonospora thailandensis]GIH72423.1 betaine-aldehyde dehydrogenase [Sphaerimonospora thailandensis]